MRTIETSIPGVVIVEPAVFGDERGFFLELWRSARYAELGLPENFVQDNVSLSGKGVLRGLHCQHPYGQGKLVTVLQGEVFDVAVDIRRGKQRRKQSHLESGWNSEHHFAACGRLPHCHGYGTGQRPDGQLVSSAQGREF